MNSAPPQLTPAKCFSHVNTLFMIKVLSNRCCATGFQWKQNCSEMKRPHSSYTVWLKPPETSRQKTGNSGGYRMVRQSFTLSLFTLSPALLLALFATVTCLHQSHIFFAYWTYWVLGHRLWHSYVERVSQFELYRA